MYHVGNSVEKIFGDIIIKKGVQTLLGFNFRDSKGELVNLNGARVKMKIFSGKDVTVEKKATISDRYNVNFSIGQEDVLDKDDMRIEFEVINSEDTITIFPSEFLQRIRIIPTSDNIEGYGIAYIVFEKLTGELQDQFNKLKYDVDYKNNLQKERVDSLINATSIERLDGIDNTINVLIRDKVSVWKYRYMVEEDNGDWTRACNAAHKEAGSGGTVLYPYLGEIKISSDILIFNKQTVRSFGLGTVTIKQVGDKPIFTSKNYYDSTGPWGFVVIKGFILKGDKTKVNNHGILLRDYYSIIEDVRVQAVGGDAFRLTTDDINGNPVSGTLVENRLINCRAYSPAGHCFWIGEADNNRLTDGMIRDCIAVGSSTTPAHIYIGSGAGWNVDSIHTYGPATISINIENTHHTKLSRLYIESFKLIGLSLGKMQSAVSIDTISIKGTDAIENAKYIYLDKSSASTNLKVNIADVLLDHWTNVNTYGIYKVSSSIDLSVTNYNIQGDIKSITKFYSPEPGMVTIKRIEDVVIDKSLRETPNRVSLRYDEHGLAQYATSQVIYGGRPVSITFNLPRMISYAKVIGSIHLHANKYHDDFKQAVWMAQFYVSAKLNGTNEWTVQFTDIIPPKGLSTPPTMSVTSNNDSTGNLIVKLTITEESATGVLAIVYAPSE
ncbi:hypothetical protein [Priestia megaterium]|uniref:hypothetical protein n=1 Tax=Priestia megaterium TaxID=1404 RepID=UPI001C43E090|nr:hypothetical protein [Priestia megaterium]MBV6736462.1 hypothetical protein [Priestia megaterium]MDR0127778.1 hypothetical protein [Priestia megaterium]